MPRGRTSEYPKAPITIVFTTSDRANAKVKMKVIRNRNIDEIIDLNYNLPGIPEKAVIKEVGIGEIFIERYQKKYDL